VAALTAPEVRDLVSRLRTTLNLGDSPPSAGLAFDGASSHRLFRELLAPVWPALGSPRVVTIATASELAQLPFAVLTTRLPESPFDAAKAGWLLREAALSRSPQPLRSGFACRRRAKPEVFFGFGDPLFKSASAPAIPPAPCAPSGTGPGHTEGGAGSDYRTCPLRDAR
jgi:hypothetical protein